jgi:hypothetical protein
MVGGGEVEGVTQQALLEHPAAGDVDVGRDVIRHPALEMPGDAGEAVGPVHPEQQHLAPVAEHELKIGVAVERAPQDQPQRGQSRLRMPAPAEGGQAEVDQRIDAPVGRVAQLPGRDLRVDEDGLAPAGRGREQVVVGGVVERAVAGPPENHGADVTQLGGAPLEFRRRGLRIAGRQGRERAETARMRADRAGGLVVGIPGQRDRVGGREGLGGGGDDGQDRHIDPGLVHRLDPALAEVLEPGLVVAHGVEGDALVPRPVRQAVERIADGSAVPVLFDRDDFHGSVLRVVRADRGRYQGTVWPR